MFNNIQNKIRIDRHMASFTVDLLSPIYTFIITLGAIPSSHAFCLHVLMMQCLGDMLTLNLYVYRTSSISPMHHISKQRRQKAWDDGIAPCDKVHL